MENRRAALEELFTNDSATHISLSHMLMIIMMAIGPGICSLASWKQLFVSPDFPTRTQTTKRTVYVPVLQLWSSTQISSLCSYCLQQD